MGRKNDAERIAPRQAIDPAEAVYGLTTRTRRAAVSIPSNTAEGQGRWTTGGLVGFLGIARGSPREVETRIRTAVRLRFVPRDAEEPIPGLATEVGRRVYGLRNSLS